MHQAGFDKEPKKIDKDLDKKLQKEAAGIINWMLEGCMEWQKDGLNVPQEILDDVAEYKDEMDVLSDFFSLCCECKKGNKSITSYGNDLFHVYQAWWGVEKRNYAPYFRQQFLDAVTERGFKKIKKDKRGVVIGGIKLKKAVSDKYDTIKTLYEGYKNDAMTAMTSFLANFVLESHVEKKPDNRVTAVIASSKLLPNSDYKTNQHLQNLKLNVLTEFRRAIDQNLALYEREHGVINSANLTEFTMWFGLHCKMTYGSRTFEATEVRDYVQQLKKITPAKSEPTIEAEGAHDLILIFYDQYSYENISG